MPEPRPAAPFNVYNVLLIAFFAGFLIGVFVGGAIVAAVPQAPLEAQIARFTDGR